MYRMQGLLGVLLVMILAVGAVYLWQRDDDDGSAAAAGQPTATPEPTVEAGPTATPEPTATPVPLPTPDLVLGGDFAFDQTDRLTTSGIGLIFFGDLLDDAGEKQGTEWVLPEGARSTCFTVTPEAGPPGVTFTVANGRVERVDVATEIITTPSGAGVGMSEADLLGLFGGSLDIAPLADGGGNRIEFIANDEADQQFRIVWHTDGSAVTSMRSGRIPYITPDDPCG